MAKDLDVVVFGASGLTGRQVAAYLAGRAGEAGASWAAAGRNAEKVERELQGIGVTAPELISADVGEPQRLRAMAERAKVVLNLVGPYTRYGRPVIEACIEGGAHYADLTGEISFVREVIDDLDPAARDAGVKVVQVCGFEALPADMSVRLAAETAKARLGEPLARADLEVSMTGMPEGAPRASDMLSGGTLQSMAAIAGSESDHDFTDPGCLVPDPGRAAAIRSASPISLRPRVGICGDAVGPMVPAAFINPAVVHRSAALAEDEPPFRYREGLVIPGPQALLPLRLAAAGGLSAVQAGMGAVAKAGPALRARTGSFLSRAFPGSGFGPQGERLESWAWRMDTLARTVSGKRVEVVLEADGHPGYLSTARMLGEAGLALAEEGATPGGAGCLTPAVALGAGSAPRFERAGLRFSVV